MYFEPPLGGTFELYQSATDNVVQWVARHGKPSVGAERTKNASIASRKAQGQKRSTYYAHEQNEKTENGISRNPQAMANHPRRWNYHTGRCVSWEKQSRVRTVST